MSEWRRTFVRERQGGHWPWGIGLGSEGSSCYVGGHEGSSCCVGGQQGWIRLSALVSGCLCEISCTGFQLAKLGSCRAQAHTEQKSSEQKPNLKGLENFWSHFIPGPPLLHKTAQSQARTISSLSPFPPPLVSFDIKTLS